MLKRFAASAGSGCSRFRTESHSTAGSSDGSEHSRDFRVDGQIKSQSEDAGEFQPSMLHDHFPRCRLWVTGIDEPRAIAIEDREHCIEHIAHHLLEVVGSLDGSVNPIHALQEPEMRLALLLCPLALDRDARKIGDLFDDGLLLWRRTSRFAGVDREGSQYPAIRRQYRRRPTRSKAVW